jgi:hypothetical protein
MMVERPASVHKARWRVTGTQPHGINVVSDRSDHARALWFLIAGATATRGMFPSDRRSGRTGPHRSNP